MADSLNPWLFSHFLNTAEKYGAQTSSIPPYEKKKKVQITEFLTFGSEDQDTYIWARVSDKQYAVPIKFSKEAVVDFRRLTGWRLTQHKGAIVTIKQFKCISCRLPLLDGGKSTKQSHLALECESVTLLGSSGESIFGNPVSLTSHPDMQLWSESLNQAGGAGNVLKERKQQRDREAGKTNAAFLDRPISMLPPPPPISQRHQLDVGVKEKIIPLRKTKVTDMASYHARWQIVEKNILYRHPPEANETDNIAPMQSVEKPDSPLREKIPAAESAQGAEVNHLRSRSGTPITSWERSPTSKLASSPIYENKSQSIGGTNATSSSVAPPTPAQRIKRPTFTPDDPPSSSFPAAVNESILGLEIDASQREAGAKVRPQVSRKVPRPTSPQPRRHTGPARVLVPNSDTSGTQSQSLSLTQQSQSLSQSQPQPRDLNRQVASNALNNAPLRVKEEIREESDNDMAMEVDHGSEEEEEQKHRRSLPLSPEAASSRSEDSLPEKTRDDGRRRYADGSESDGGSSTRSSAGNRGGEREGPEEEADWSDDGYPWMTLGSIRRVIVEADALRGRLHKGLLS